MFVILNETEKTTFILRISDLVCQCGAETEAVHVVTSDF